MPRVQWPLWRNRPCVQVALALTVTGQPLPRNLLADTGAGNRHSDFELVLDEMDCLRCGVRTSSSIFLGGAYSGRFWIYDVPVQIPALGFTQRLRAVGVPSVPAGFDGIAAFRFLNRFTYGNFGDPGQFGLEC
ncbi:MAG TPA: hypothetical protein VMF69_21410 [Gemmataceae bacterium]|nr:hypothetical protein [Gemmataceae bacterium]